MSEFLVAGAEDRALDNRAMVAVQMVAAGRLAARRGFDWDGPGVADALASEVCKAYRPGDTADALVARCLPAAPALLAAAPAMHPVEAAVLDMLAEVRSDGCPDADYSGFATYEAAAAAAAAECEAGNGAVPFPISGGGFGVAIVQTVRDEPAGLVVSGCL